MSAIEDAPALALVTHNSIDHLGRFLDGQLAIAERLGAPVVVADNASRDGTVELLRRRQAEGRMALVSLDRNRGYAAGVNAAAGAVPDRDLMLINPDVELRDPGQVEGLVAFMAAEPAVAVVAPRLVDADGNPQPTARRFPNAITMLARMPVAGRLSVTRRAYARYVRPSLTPAATRVDWVIGAAMLIRRRAYDEVGGWDERYFLYVEDTDFCRRCALAGWEVAYLPAVSLLHSYERVSTGEDITLRSSPERRRHLLGMARFFARNPALALGIERRRRQARRSRKRSS